MRNCERPCTDLFQVVFLSFELQGSVGTVSMLCLKCRRFENAS